MINKRYRRDYRPQENLRQFSLNNSRGIDETKPITDTDTVLEMENLTVNDDGTLSLRKRMQPAYIASSETLAILWTGEHTFGRKLDGTYGLFNRVDRSEVMVIFEGNDYYTSEAKELSWALSSDYFDFTNASFVNTSDTTVIGNCRVSATRMAEAALLDAALYDAIDDVYLPRYVQISNTEDVFKVRIINPELNRIDGSSNVPLNPNMTLDNPYAVRDGYANTVPSVSGMLLYESTADVTTSNEHVSILSDTKTADAKFEASPETACEFKTDGDCSVSVVTDTLNHVPRLSFINVPDNGMAEPVYYYTKVSNIAVEKIDSENKYHDLSDGISDYCNFSYEFSPLEYVFSYTTSTYSHFTFKTNNVETGDSFKGLYVWNWDVPNEKNISKIVFACKYPNWSSQHSYDYFSGVAHIYKTDGSVLYEDLWGESTLVNLDKTLYRVQIDCATYGHLGLFEIDVVGQTFTRRVYYTDADAIAGTNFTMLAQYSPSFSDLFLNNTIVLRSIKLTISKTGRYVADAFFQTRVSELTENVKKSYRAVTSVPNNPNFNKFILKAFCNLPSAKDTYYATWDYSVDNVSWNPYGSFDFTKHGSVKYVEVLNEQYSPPLNVEELPDKDADGNAHYVKRPYVALNPGSSSDSVISSTSGDVSRIDVFPLAYLKTINSIAEQSALLLRFSIITLREVSKEGSEDVTYRQNALVASQIWSPSVQTSVEYLETDLPNAVLGEKLYYKKSLYSFGTESYDSFSYVTDPDSFVTPLYNILDLDVRAKDFVHAVVPWRNYIMSFAEHSIHLSSRLENGFTTRTVSTSLGVPYQDRYSAKSILNGVIFKSGSKVYYAYPNPYASSDNVLSLTHVSKPIDHILDSIPTDIQTYAAVVDSQYVLLIPQEDRTLCFAYDTSNKCWEHYTYPVVFDKIFEDRFGTFTVFNNARNIEYTLFEENLTTALPRVKISLYGYSDNTTASEVYPISFSWDTGQKTDSVSNTKQFVESKLVFATLDEKDSFPFTLYVAIDGDPRVTTMDVSTDAPFWKPNDFGSDDPSKGVLNTNIRLGGAETPATGAFNTLRQLVVRYSGKGKSIRHVIQGGSVCNFKLYETYVRYKNINGK